MVRTITLLNIAIISLLLTPSACSSPTIQTDVYTWGYKEGLATYLTWKQCDFKKCTEVSSCVTNHMDVEILTYGNYPHEFDSLLFEKDCWTNECPDALYTHVYQ
jgi:hypothetical protein